MAFMKFTLPAEAITKLEEMETDIADFEAEIVKAVSIGIDMSKQKEELASLKKLRAGLLELYRP